MRKTLLLITIALLQNSCSNTSKNYDKWIGESKQKLIKEWGFPFRIFQDNYGNEIFLYADQVFIDDNDSGMAGPSYWKYNYMYVNKEGKIFSWRDEKQKFPPQGIEAKNVIGLSTESAK